MERPWAKHSSTYELYLYVHRRMTLWHSFERALGYGASALELGFGFFQYFIHPNRRTVHDRIAETIVVRDSALARRAEPGTVAQ
jgi:uncharacterized RDD family membrane protein YckC